MKPVLAVLAIGLLGGSLFFSGLLTPQDPPKLRLQAVLSQSGEDVTDLVDWFVEWDGAWMGPDFATVTDAAPGSYTSRFQVLGGEDVVSEQTLAEGEGGTLLADLDATLVEVALPPESRPQQVSFRFESHQSVGSQSVFVSDDSFARTLVSRDLSDLQLELEGQAIEIKADFASGAVLGLVLKNNEVRVGE